MISKIVNKVRRFFEKKSVVLMYHRVANIDTDPWELAVSPENFEQQLQILTKSFKVIPVESLGEKIAAKAVLHKEACITFDDGYKDNFFAAKPLLEKYNCPATFFLASHYIDSDDPFWWDELEDILLNSAKLPSTLSIAIRGDLLDYKFENDGELTTEQRNLQRSWTWPNKPATQRCEIYLDIWLRLRPLPLNEITALLDEVKKWANYQRPQARFCMGTDQIEAILKNPLFSIGIHTVTHPALASHAAEKQYQEINDCKTFLENKFGRPLNSIAYPYGNYNDDTLDISKKMLLSASFTTEANFITNKADTNRLGRFQVKNWNGEQFEKQLYQWVKAF